jgi:hypothetical protein
MTNRRTGQSAEKNLGQPRGANVASAENLDVCELLVAELQSRRARLQKLLQLVRTEAERIPAGRFPLGSRARCGNVRFKHLA